LKKKYIINKFYFFFILIKKIKKYFKNLNIYKQSNCEFILTNNFYLYENYFILNITVIIN
jgi:hypothetical protein